METLKVNKINQNVANKILENVSDENKNLCDLACEELFWKN